MSLTVSTLAHPLTHPQPHPTRPATSPSVFDSRSLLWLGSPYFPFVSRFPRLHVGGDGASLSQALKALVGVVQEDPVFGLEIRLGGIGY